MQVLSESDDRVWEGALQPPPAFLATSYKALATKIVDELFIVDYRKAIDVLSWR